jgi:prepilin-type N-terminal cleavage/methylation domain-containing protein
MLNRRGVTLVELMVGIVMMGIIGAALLKVFTSLMGTSGAQVRLAATQGEARIGTLMLPQEFREIGYDTVIVDAGTDYANTDLIAIAGDQLSFLASRGTGITCGTFNANEFRIRRPIIGQRMPVVSDTFVLFLEMEKSTGTDDRWVPMDVTAIDYNSTCNGTDPAIALTVSPTPKIEPGGDNIVLTNHSMGGPIRWMEAVEYGPVSSGGEWFVGRRSISLGEVNFTPVIGPLSSATGVGFTYYNAAGTALAANAGNRVAVRSIRVSLSTVTEGTVSLAGTTNRAVATFPVVTRVSLRNSLRP